MTGAIDNVHVPDNQTVPLVGFVINCTRATLRSDDFKSWLFYAICNHIKLHLVSRVSQIQCLDQYRYQT